MRRRTFPKCHPLEGFIKMNEHSIKVLKNEQRRLSKQFDDLCHKLYQLDKAINTLTPQSIYIDDSNSNDDIELADIDFNDLVLSVPLR